MGIAWITPKENWIAGDGFGYSDANRIEGNLDYIKNQDASFKGIKTLVDASPTWFFENTASSNKKWKLEGSGNNFQITEDGVSVAAIFAPSTINLNRTVVTNGQLRVNGAVDDGSSSFIVEGDSLISGGSFFIKSSSPKIDLINTASGDKTWRLEASTNNFQITEAGVAVVARFSPSKIELLRKQYLSFSTPTLFFENTGSGNKTWKLEGSGNNFQITEDGVSVALKISSASFDFDRSINPTTTPTSGTWTADQVIPRGQYMVRLNNAGGSAKIVHAGVIIMQDLNIGGGEEDQLGGVIFSDGINTATSISTGNIQYWKF